MPQARGKLDRTNCTTPPGPRCQRILWPISVPHTRNRDGTAPGGLLGPIDGVYRVDCNCDMSLTVRRHALTVGYGRARHERHGGRRAPTETG